MIADRLGLGCCQGRVGLGGKCIDDGVRASGNAGGGREGST